MSLRRHVSVHLTSFAPGVDDARIDDRRRWVTHWAKTPAWVIQDLCQRLQAQPAALAVRPGPPGTDDIEILGPSAVGEGRVCLALVNYGLTVEEIAGALAGLAQGRRVAA